MNTTAAPAYVDTTLAAIQSLTDSLGHYPSPLDVRLYLCISRQLLQYRIGRLERAGLVVRLNHGHALKLTTPVSQVAS